MNSGRTFIGSMTGGLFSTALAVEAQPPARTFRIGFLGGASAALYANLLEALRLGLGDLGYVEGRNITVDYRWADGQYDRLPGLASELVRLEVDVINEIIR